MTAKIGTIRDLFAGDTLDPQWGASAAVTVSGGALHLPSFDVVGPTPPYSSLASVALLDATDSSAFIQATAFVGYFGCGHTIGPLWWEFFRDGADLVGDSDNGTGYNEDWRLTYDATAHRFLRLRNASNVLYWDTAPDGVTWTTQGSRADGGGDFTSGKLTCTSSASTGIGEQTVTTWNALKLAPSSSVMILS